MPARFRSRDMRQTVIGTYRNYATGSSTQDSFLTGATEECSDHVGNRLVVNPLDIQYIDRTFPVLYGKRYSGLGVLQREFIGYPVGNRRIVPDPRSKFPQYSTLQLNNLAWQILAQTNPSRSHVNVPAFLGELRDVPKLVKDWGGGLLRKIAKGNITYKFGIAPMVSDLRKLVKFSDSVNQRMRMLKKLRDGKTIRKRVSLGTAEMSDPISRELIHSNGAFLYGGFQPFYAMKAWGTAEWKLLPDTDLPMMNEDELKKLATRLSLGISTRGALEAAWELTPWSWFIDWFSNVGDVLAATNNTVPCTWGRVAVMRHSECRVHVTEDPVGSDTWPTYSGWYKLVRRRKERWSASPTIPVPLPYLPFLDKGQLSILLSLAALRR